VIVDILCSNVYGQDSALVAPTVERNKGFMDFNGYYDSREFSVLTFNLLAKMLHRFQYFSLTNFQGGQATSDLNGYYSEQNIRWGIQRNGPFDLAVQWVTQSGMQNDKLRLGFRWRFNAFTFLDELLTNLNLYYFINIHILEFGEQKATHYLTQLEHVYNIKILPKLFNNRLYVGGFADQNINYKDNGKITFDWVTEHQLGIKVLAAFYAVAEYRINDFLPSGQEGWGYGLQYKINF
jgi:hypothetical protein